MKRRLCVAIAMIGDPAVVLLDEPTTGLDPASKQSLWEVVNRYKRRCAMMLTTHSMEEAAALSSRAGILAKTFLAVGSVEELRRRWGDGYYIHLVLKSAPITTDQEMTSVKRWVSDTFRGASVEDRSFRGQVRFSVPTYRGVNTQPEGIAPVNSPGGVNRVFKTLEENKNNLGLEYYSVSQTTLDQAFLAIVGSAHVQEEGYGAKKKSWWRFSH